MKKQLLTVALVAVFVAPFSANADDSAITEIWKTPQLADFDGTWGGATTNWANRNEVMAKSDTRFATAKDGKIYTVNQKTQCIAEVTITGLKDVYELPQPKNSADYYGVGISIDEAGNFLLNMNYTQRPSSSLKWAVYSPTEKALKEFDLSAPSGWNIGRIDCVGRVLGDLTKEAYFYIVPEQGYTSKVREVMTTGTGTVASIEMDDYNDVSVEGNNCQQNIAQPAYYTLAEAKAASADYGVLDFYYSSCAATAYYAEYKNCVLKSNFAPNMEYTTQSQANGFDTFVINGKRYFVRNYSTGTRLMDIVVMDENGNSLATWTNPQFVNNGGYSTIIAEPLSDNTANIYVFNCTNSDGAGAMLNFDPSKAGQAVVPEVPAGTIDNPHKISTPEELQNWASKMTKGDVYFVIENDIDMKGYAYEPPLTDPKNNWSGVYLHIDGQNHVIKNLTIGSTPSASFIGIFMGELRNLGLVDLNINSTEWGGGAFAAIAGHSSYSGTTVIDNCFTTGTVCTNGYCGGIAGYNYNSKLEITNCYSSANISNATAYCAGILGYHTAASTTLIENAYASGKINGGVAGGILAGEGSATLNNTIAWNPSVTGLNSTGAIACDYMSIDGINNYIWEGTVVNDKPVEDGKTAEELQKIATGWSAYNNNLNDGYPVLSWQEANDMSGINDIAVDNSADVPAVYYNLQGVQVANPENGIFIVKRGNKVSKEIIR